MCIWLSSTNSEIYVIKFQFKVIHVSQRFCVDIHSFFFFFFLSNSFPFCRYACVICTFFSSMIYNSQTPESFPMEVWIPARTTKFVLIWEQFCFPEIPFADHSVFFFPINLQVFSNFILKLTSHTDNKQASKYLGCIYLSTTSLNTFQNLLCLKNFWRKMSSLF